MYTSESQSEVAFVQLSKTLRLIDNSKGVTNY